MSKSPFAAVPSPYREMMEGIDPTAIYVFAEEMGLPTSCFLLPTEASPCDLVKAQREQQGGGRLSRTLRGSDVRAFILTLAQAHGLSRGVFVDLRAKVDLSEDHEGP
jgi:hypothetical protein